MRTTIGVYKDKQKAEAAVMELKRNEFPVEIVSVIGVEKFEDEKSDTEVEREIAEEKKITNTETYEIAGSAAVGTAIGILTGAGLFAIPGLGILFGAGALVGAIAGLDIGLIGGGLIAALSIAGMKDEHTTHYEKHIKEGSFLLIADGSQKDATIAREILKKHGKHIELNVH